MNSAIPGRALIIFLSAAWFCGALLSNEGAEQAVEVGVAVRDVTPREPVWLAGYAARTKPSERVDTPLLAQAIAFRTSPREQFVLVSLDNCEVSREFTAPVLRKLSEKHQLEPGRVMIVSSHTHSAPVLLGPLLGMYPLTALDQDKIAQYGRQLEDQLVEVVTAALEDLKPAQLEHGVGHVTFAVNRRTYLDDKMSFGENLDGPVDWEVPVLRIKGTNNTLRAILYGYACHGTSIHGNDFYAVSGDYMAYARQHLTELYPGTVAAYFTGMGADSNPSPRGTLADSKRHGLELAGAVASVLDRPMRPVTGRLKMAYREVQLPLAPPPAREQLEKDAQSKEIAVRHRAQKYLGWLEKGTEFPQSVLLPLSAARIGDDLTFVSMGGEVVVDYATRFKRLFANDHPWLIGYAYEVPCYIPSVRILMEGGYEADSSLIYYGIYGPLRGKTEEILVSTMTELVKSVRDQ